MKFKVGDKVRCRSVCDGARVTVGREYVIKKLRQHHKRIWSGLIGVTNDVGSYTEMFAERFEPVAPERPWLKVTPSQPEKRELQSAYLIGQYKLTVCDCSDRDGYDSVRISEGPYGINKEQLRELGKTLIEISKEMK